jgi:hypothetical protein
MKGSMVCLALGLLCGLGGAVDMTLALGPRPVVAQGPVLRGMATGSRILLAVRLPGVDAERSEAAGRPVHMEVRGAAAVGGESLFAGE